ncbi:MAG TPA: DUF885 domain-containing protein [Acidimicrobiia bacterium]|jgi:uncharacterized protein (DUF885 family)|nr:DUF885 domain-containing protein [Acidimicrobiia bacterium]
MNEQLRQLGEQYWDYTLERQPTQALMLGDHRYDDRFEDMSRQAEDAVIGRLREFAAEAETIDPAGLTPDERISRDVLIFEAGTSADMQETRQAELAVNHTIGLQTTLPVIVPMLPLTEPEHALAMPAKFTAMARSIRQSAVRFQEGVANGRLPIRYHADKTVEQIDEYLASPAEEDPYLGLRTPEAFSEADAADWRAEIADVIASEIRPAWEEFRRVVAEEVAPAARSSDQPGVCFLADGEELYRRAIRRHTSIDLSAEEIHEIGLSQIAKLDDEYRTLGGEVLGTTDLTEIYNTLRNDPALRFEDGPSIVTASEMAMAKAKAAMGDWFGRLPQADCVVQETPHGPTAYYFPPATDGSRPGTFFINTADPTRWHRFEIESMAYHEGIPGHHLQLAISGELEDVPEFRKHARVTAYAEGWGLYTERLADEMGLYSGAMERIGMLSADSMRAGRLVVDTGLHAMGWTRQQAIDYFADNSPMSMTSIEGEVDRYIGMPGQALAYMVGRLEITKYRDHAHAELGDRFDIKGFHDTVLGSGLVPLPTLERMVDEWVRAS